MSDEIQKNSMLLKELQTLSQSIVNEHDNSKSEIEMKISKTEEFTGVLQTNILKFKKALDDRVHVEAANSRLRENWVSEITLLASDAHKLQETFLRGELTAVILQFFPSLFCPSCYTQSVDKGGGLTLNCC